MKALLSVISVSVLLLAYAVIWETPFRPYYDPVKQGSTTTKALSCTGRTLLNSNMTDGITCFMNNSSSHELVNVLSNNMFWM